MHSGSTNFQINDAKQLTTISCYYSYIVNHINFTQVFTGVGQMQATAPHTLKTDKGQLIT